MSSTAPSKKAGKDLPLEGAEGTRKKGSERGTEGAGEKRQGVLHVHLLAWVGVWKSSKRVAATRTGRQARRGLRPAQCAKSNVGSLFVFAGFLVFGFRKVQVRRDAPLDCRVHQAAGPTGSGPPRWRRQVALWAAASAAAHRRVGLFAGAGAAMQEVLGLLGHRLG